MQSLAFNLLLADEHTSTMETKPEASMSQSEVVFLDSDFSELVQSLLDKYHVPGLSIAIVENGKISAKVRNFFPEL